MEGCSQSAASIDHLERQAYCYLWTNVPRAFLYLMLQFRFHPDFPQPVQMAYFGHLKNISW